MRLVLTVRLPNVDALPSEQPCVNRPGAGPEDGQSSRQSAQENAGRGIAVAGYGFPSFEDGDQRTGYRRPQAGKQERSTCHPNYRGHCLPGGRSSSEDEESVGYENTSGYQPHEQKTRARPAVSESREETPQGTPARGYPTFAHEPSPERTGPEPLFRVVIRPLLSKTLTGVAWRVWRTRPMRESSAPLPCPSRARSRGSGSP